MENYRELLRFIIENTDSQIALIPHVVWQRNDDRKPIHELYEEFHGTGRVLEIADATCVPTLVVGYSVKARGIAKDLFGAEENYVLPVQSLKNKDDLVKGFQWLLSHEKAIRKSLKEQMPAYQQKALQIGKEVDRLWEECTSQPPI